MNINSRMNSTETLLSGTSNPTDKVETFLTDLNRPNL